MHGSATTPGATGRRSSRASRRGFTAGLPKITREALRIAAEARGAAAFIDLPGLAERVGQQDAEGRLKNEVLSALQRPREQNGAGFKD